MAMNTFEIKGFMGEHIAHDGDDSIDSIRFRNPQLDLTNGRGSQIDVNWNFENNLGSASYSMIQALPKWGALQLYPLAGLGITGQIRLRYAVLIMSMVVLATPSQVVMWL
nr:hypothetical protein [Photobacterium leiognathi]